MKAVTREEFIEIVKADPYYRGRWGYIEAALALAKAVLPRIRTPKIIEIGPGSHPLFEGSTILDVKGAPHFPPHDVGIAPWPTQKADLVIGLQVWEHLGPHDSGRQETAFTEAMRIADNVILSFPLNWHCPQDPTHHGITRETIRRWTLDIEPTAEIFVKPRLIQLWRIE